MTAAEFRAARAALGLTQKALAERLRMGKYAWQSIGRWESGEHTVPGPVEIALEHLLHCERGIARPVGTKDAREGNSHE